MLEFERKDAWDMKWSDDNPELLSVMEKNRMYVFRDLKPEEPVNSSCYLCQFSDLCIKTVQMDDIISDPEHPDKDCVVNFETKVRPVLCYAEAFHAAWHGMLTRVWCGVWCGVVWCCA
jgi:WD repeat-containing protein 35